VDKKSLSSRGVGTGGGGGQVIACMCPIGRKNLKGKHLGHQNTDRRRKDKKYFKALLKYLIFALVTPKIGVYGTYLLAP